MRKNRQALARLVRAKRVGGIPAQTLRDHIAGRKRAGAFYLALYVRLGLPLEGWLSAAELRELDKLAPWPKEVT